MRLRNVRCWGKEAWLYYDVSRDEGHNLHHTGWCIGAGLMRGGCTRWFPSWAFRQCEQLRLPGKYTNGIPTEPIPLQPILKNTANFKFLPALRAHSMPCSHSQLLGHGNIFCFRKQCTVKRCQIFSHRTKRQLLSIATANWWSHLGSLEAFRVSEDAEGRTLCHLRSWNDYFVSSLDIWIKNSKIFEEADGVRGQVGTVVAGTLIIPAKRGWKICSRSVGAASVAEIR